MACIEHLQIYQIDMWLIDITLVENKLHDGVVAQNGLSTAR